LILFIVYGSMQLKYNIYDTILLDVFKRFTNYTLL
jgi:hypothetical protein